MQAIYKILSPEHWAQMRADGVLTPQGVDAADGYVHFSTAAQLIETLDTHFSDHADLIVLAVASDDLGVALKWEASRGGDLFPHLYDILRIDDIRADFAVNRARDGLAAWLAASAKEMA